MLDIEKTKAAKTYIDKMANGINPIDDSQIPDEELLNNVHIARCLYFVSDILRQVIDGKLSPTDSKATIPFYLTEDELKNFNFSNEPLSITHIVKRFNKLCNNESMKKLTYKNIASWLMSEGLICKKDMNGSNRTMPTQLGLDLGIVTELRTSSKGEYYAVLYSNGAQHYIVDNFYNIINLMNENK